MIELSDERVLTGIKGLDELVKDGIPKGGIYLVLGGPGAGKTTLNTQFLVNGINEFKENGVFATLVEGADRIRKDMGQFGWDLDKMEKSGNLRLIDASPNAPDPITKMSGNIMYSVGINSIGQREFSLINLIKAIQSNAEEIDAKRIVVDSMGALIFQYPEYIQRRNAIMDLFRALEATGATCFVAQELKDTGLERQLLDEEYLSSGVILMQSFKVGKVLTRVIQIEKMRRSAADNQPRPYRITNKGIEVFPKEGVF